MPPMAWRPIHLICYFILFAVCDITNADGAETNPFKTPKVTDPKNVGGLEHNFYETNFKGAWELIIANAGVSSMHMALFHTNKVLMFDSTAFGPSQIPLPNGKCRPVPKKPKEKDCWSHAIMYDLFTGKIRPLMIYTDTWCSSGSFSPEGILVQTGGWNDGGRAIRYLEGCDTCDWREYPVALSGQRWYSSQQILPNGGYVVFGGRRMFSYEYVPPEGKVNPQKSDTPLALLRETTDIYENNLYPFVHLSTDGNIFVFANNRSILLNLKTNKVVKEFPVLAGGSRNYPGSGMSAMLPIKLGVINPPVIPVEVLVCGGGQYPAFKLAEKKIFLPALDSCGKIEITAPNAQWEMDRMPAPRVMADMLNLPTGEILMINGAKKGASGWQFAEEPYYAPVLYRPWLPLGQRFSELTPSKIPRMYHSTAGVLPDGKILVAGSNTNSAYNFTGVRYPTELRVEKFSPWYMDPIMVLKRPVITTRLANFGTLKYGMKFLVDFVMPQDTNHKEEVKVFMYAPPFTTHGYSQNQRILELAVKRFIGVSPGRYRLRVFAPPSAVIAPPGYYLLNVLYRGLPSKAEWVKIA
ncbi:hypothetical protein Syun_026058 [Stephania yunnanensis]|uniref:Uncharacterized protein n=1 Tax=Stephania yunnanensis TaxID=152371 RepID=A0AAP0HRU8_9MAGN